MTIGIVGAGLIGGSLTKAAKKAGHTVFVFDKDEATVEKVIFCKAADGMLGEKELGQCDIVVVALYVSAAIEYINENAARFKRGAIVADVSGIKEEICEKVKKGDFFFLGTHPMAGVEKSGFENSFAELFAGAPIIFTSPLPEAKFDIAKEFFLGLGFGRVVVSNPAEHDRIIAFTSQLAHVVSSAYIKSETAEKYDGFSAGSFKDLTRVAWLNENMWSELFIGNGENLCREIDGLINRLSEYSAAIKEKDKDKLKALLKEGKDKMEKLR